MKKIIFILFSIISFNAYSQCSGIAVKGATKVDTLKACDIILGGTQIAVPTGSTTTFLRGDGTFAVPSGTTSGTVTTVSVVTANGVSGSVANATTTPAITLTLGAITPSTVNGVALSGSSTPTLAVAGTTTISGTHSGTSSGTNTGDQTSVSGNAGTATALQTPRAINGTNFDGTTPITVTAAPSGSAGGDLSSAYPNPIVSKINGTSLAGLATGILKNTTSTGVPSIAIAADFPTLNQNTSGNAATVTTNANLTGPITSSGNATSIASQTGTGTKFVVDNTPTLITPNIGVATATSVNKVTITQPATGATLTLADGSTLQVSGAFLTQLISSAATTATLPSGTYTIAKSTDVQVFTGATATWTKPTGAKSVFVLIIGCGGGGGSGRKSASLTLATGGGGGSAGSSGFGTFDASFLTSTVSVQVGQGGTGGASTTTNSTDGSVGQSTTFYTNTLFGNYLQCGRGGPGSAGTALGAATGGTAPAGFFNGVAGGASSATGGIGSNGGNSLQFGGAPGGAGGGITTIAAASAGGNGGTNGSGGIAGGSGGAVNTNGSNGQVFGYLGTGGGGGGASTTTNAGAGGNGANYGGGGGGGGGALDGVGNSGAGGNGAPGICVVITYF